MPPRPLPEENAPLAVFVKLAADCIYWDCDESAAMPALIPATTLEPDPVVLFDRIRPLIYPLSTGGNVTVGTMTWSEYCTFCPSTLSSRILPTGTRTVEPVDVDVT